MTKRDYIPDSYHNLHDWSGNFATQLPAIATRINWPTTSVTGLTAVLGTLTAKTQAVLDAQKALDAAVGQLNEAKGQAFSQIRMDVKNLKATHGFTDGDAKTLGVYVTPETFDPNTYQPPLQATSRHNYVELSAKKLGVDSLTLYWRPAGTAPWTLLAAKRVRFPFHDETPLPAGQTMQAREYMAMGVIADNEIGNPSNIAGAVFQS